MLKNKWNLTMNSATIVFIGSFFAVIGSLIAAYGAYLGANQKAKDYLHLLSSLTGGVSHPVIIASPNDGNFFIYVSGEYPLHEVSGQIFDICDLRVQQTQGINTLAPIPRAQRFNIGTLSSAYGVTLMNSSTGLPINIKDYEKRKSYRFMAHLYSRHHTFVYFLALEPHEKYEGAWYQAWEIYRDNQQEPFAQTIPEDFPLVIDWKVEFKSQQGPKQEKNMR